MTQAKYQRINRYKPGLYAIRISGQLPEAIQEELEDKGVNYKGRMDDD